jgi:hypothetical protein
MEPKSHSKGGLSQNVYWTRLLSFNRKQSWVVYSLLTAHITLRRHRYIMQLNGSRLCRRCGAEKETSAHVLCECEALVTLRHAYLGSFFLDPQDVRSLCVGQIWNYIKEQGSHNLDISLRGTKGLSKRRTCIKTKRAQTHLLFYSIQFYTVYTLIKMMA